MNVRAVAFVVLVAAASCGRSGPPAAAAASPALRGDPVGPIPGPGGFDHQPNPLASEADAATRGRRLFMTFNCAGCHGDHGGGGMGPSLRDADWIYGGRDADVHDSIAQGRAHGMPAWGAMIDDRQAWQLTAYIRSLRTDREPEPPR